MSIQHLAQIAITRRVSGLTPRQIKKGFRGLLDQHAQAIGQHAGFFLLGALEGRVRPALYTMS